MIPPQLAILLAQYGTKILAALILVASLVAGYYYWKHEVSVEAHDKAVDACNASREKFRIDAEHFKLAKIEEVDKANKQQTERVRNALEIYVRHYESSRDTPPASSLRIKADCAISTSSDTVPGADQSRSKVTAGSERTGEAEVSSGALRQFNKVIDDIERMELKCEQLLNSLP